MFNVTLLCCARVGSWTTLKEMVWAILYTDLHKHTQPHSWPVARG